MSSFAVPLIVFQIEQSAGVLQNKHGQKSSLKSLKDPRRVQYKSCFKTMLKLRPLHYQDHQVPFHWFILDLNSIVRPPHYKDHFSSNQGVVLVSELQGKCKIEQTGKKSNILLIKSTSKSNCERQALIIVEQKRKKKNVCLIKSASSRVLRSKLPKRSIHVMFFVE